LDDPESTTDRHDSRSEGLFDRWIDARYGLYPLFAKAAGFCHHNLWLMRPARNGQHLANKALLSDYLRDSG